MSLSYRNQILWLIYITIGNLDIKTQQFQKRQETLLPDSILIIYKRFKDANNKNKD